MANCPNEDTPAPTPLFQRRFVALLRARFEMITHDQARAGIPTQQRVVVACRADFLCSFIRFHRGAQQLKGGDAGAGRALLELALAVALTGNASVVEPLVGVG